jgi:flagellar biosynthesis protein FliR
MMDNWLPILMPFILILGRVTAFFMTAPLFSWQALPMVIRSGIALVVSIFLAYVTPPAAIPDGGHWLAATLLLVGEVMCGLAMGLAAQLVYLSVQQAGFIISQQMGLAEAGIIDPVTGEEGDPLALYLDMALALFFLAAGGHRLMTALLFGSYDMFPVGSPPSTAALTAALVQAGSTMLIFALKIAAPMLAAFLVLSIVLGVLARVLPELNVLMESFPLRVAMGLFVAAAMVPTLGSFAGELGDWMQTHLLM